MSSTSSRTVSEDAAGVLDRCRVGRLATVDAAGAPHAIPICYALVDGVIVHVVDDKPKARGRTLERIRNVGRDPRIALVVDHWDEDWTRLEYVLVRGRAAVIDDAAEFDRGLVALRARYAPYRSMDLTFETHPMVRITPERVHHWRAASL